MRASKEIGQQPFLAPKSQWKAMVLLFPQTMTASSTHAIS